MARCECEVWQFCVKYGRAASPGVRKICRGESLTPEKCEILRERWKREAAGISSGPEPSENLTPALPENHPCEFRGDHAGAVDCLLCGQVGTKADSFHCEKFGICTVGQHGATDNGLKTGNRIKVCLGCEFLPDT